MTKKSVNIITVTCDFCGFRHKTSECRKLKASKEALSRGEIASLPASSAPKFKGTCSKCGRYVHKRKDCTAEGRSGVSNVNGSAEVSADLQRLIRLDNSPRTSCRSSCRRLPVVRLLYHWSCLAPY